MRRFHRGNKPKQKPIKDFLINEKIVSPILMIIDDAGNSIGELSKADALAMAKEKDLDLVEVSPKAQPPIAKFMNYGSFKYKKEKQERKAKSKNKISDTKTVKTSSRISDHDRQVRVNKAIKFLAGDDKVRIELQLRGREHQHVELAREGIAKIIEEIKVGLAGKEIKLEQAISKQGSKISAIIALNK